MIIFYAHEYKLCTAANVGKNYYHYKTVGRVLRQIFTFSLALVELALVTVWFVHQFPWPRDCWMGTRAEQGAAAKTKQGKFTLTLNFRDPLSSQVGYI